MLFAGETEVLRENLPRATLSTTNPTWIDPGSNPGLRGERPATNRLSHGTATFIYYLLQYYIPQQKHEHTEISCKQSSNLPLYLVVTRSNIIHSNLLNPP
jgi:hypothetical protein